LGELGLCLCEAGEIEAAAEQLARGESLIRQRKVRTCAVIPIVNGLAQVEVARLESKSEHRNTGNALRSCLRAVSMGRRFYFGLSRALRLMGTYYWLTGHRRQAERRWQESLAVASNVGAHYEIALTQIEIGKRLGQVTELRRGEELLWRCRAVEEHAPPT